MTYEDVTPYGFLTFGGCPAGRARKKKYGVNPNEAIPKKKLK